MARLMKQGIFASIFFFTFLVIYPDNQEVAQNYLRRAYSTLASDTSVAENFLRQSFDYAHDYPEYYAMMLTVNQNRQKRDSYRELADNIMRYLDRCFIIEKYDLLKAAADAYRTIHDYENAESAFKKILAIKEQATETDHLSYIKMLFDRDDQKGVKEAINGAAKLYSGADLLYNKALYALRYNDTPWGDPHNMIRALEASEYAPAKILYLHSFITDPTGRTAFIETLTNSSIDPVWMRNIIENTVKAIDTTDDGTIGAVLALWLNSDGNADYRSYEILENSAVKAEAAILPAVAAMQNYTGKRILDSDDDGIPEIIFTIQNGIVIEKIFDQDQDGVPEVKYSYTKNGTIGSGYRYFSAVEYVKFIFNTHDSSLISADFYKNGQLDKKYIIDGSTLFFDENGGLPDEAALLKNTDYVESYYDGTVRDKYFSGTPVYSLRDRDNDGYFEYKGIYENGELSEAMIDTDNDKIAETMNHYENGKLSSVFVKSDPFFPEYDYKEFIYNDRDEKYWDEDQDGNYELKVVEYPESREIYFDINYDNTYDYEETTASDGSSSIYKIANGRATLIRTLEKDAAKPAKGWIVLSDREPAALPTPEQIIFSDEHSGTFVYKGKKAYFSDNVIVTDDFSYTIMRNRFGIFLFDNF